MVINTNATQLKHINQSKIKNKAIINEHTNASNRSHSASCAPLRDGRTTRYDSDCGDEVILELRANGTNGVAVVAAAVGPTDTVRI